MKKKFSKTIQWIIAVMLGISMLGAFSYSAVSGFFMLLATVIVYPFTREKICTFLNNKLGEKSPLKKIKGWVYGVIAFLFVCVAASASSTPAADYDEMLDNINEMQTVAETLANINETISAIPTAKPTSSPTPLPIVTATPSPISTSRPTATPSPLPTLEPTPKPTARPTASPIPQPTEEPTPQLVDEQPKSSQNVESMVWIPQSGKRYHSYSGCSGMKNPSQVTKSEAQSMGFTACSRCY